MPTVPTYGPLKVSAAPSPAAKMPDIGDAYAATKMADVKDIETVSAFVKDEVEQGKRIALNNFQAQLDMEQQRIQQDILSLDGVDAIDAQNKARDAWMQAKDKITSGIALADLRGAADSYAQRKGAELEFSAFKQAEAAREKMDALATEQRQLANESNAALNAGTPAIVNAAVADAKANREAWAKGNGIPTEGDDATTLPYRTLVQKAASGVYFSAVRAAIDAGNPALGRAYFEQAKASKDLTDDHLSILTKMLEQADKEASQADLIGAMNKMDAYRRNHSNIPLSPREIVGGAVYDKLDYSSRAQLENYANPRNTLNSYNAYMQANQAYVNNKQQFGAMTMADLNKQYLQYMDEGMREKVRSLWLDASGVRRNAAGTRKITLDAKMIRDVLNNNGYPFVANPVKGSPDDAFRSAYNINALQALEDRQIELGRELTKTETEEVLNNLLVRQAYVKTPWYQKDEELPASFVPMADRGKARYQDTGLPMEELTPTGEAKEEARIDKSLIPPNRYTQIESAIRTARNGAPVSQDDVERWAYAYKTKNQALMNAIMRGSR